MDHKERLVQGTEWTVAPDNVLVCPCNHRVEDDGKCPEGHVSPMKTAGLI